MSTDWLADARRLLEKDGVRFDPPGRVSFKHLKRLHRIGVALAHAVAVLSRTLRNPDISNAERERRLQAILPIVESGLSEANIISKRRTQELTTARQQAGRGKFLFRDTFFHHGLHAVISFADAVLSTAKEIDPKELPLSDEKTPEHLHWPTKHLTNLTTEIWSDVSSVLVALTQRTPLPAQAGSGSDAQWFKQLRDEWHERHRLRLPDGTQQQPSEDAVRPMVDGCPIELLGKDKKPNARINGEYDTITPREYDAAKLLLENPEGFTVAQLRDLASRDRRFKGILEALRTLKKRALWAPWLASPKGLVGDRWRFLAAPVPVEPALTPRTP
jgi:hypothetical protein